MCVEVYAYVYIYMHAYTWIYIDERDIGLDGDESLCRCVCGDDTVSSVL